MPASEAISALRSNFSIRLFLSYAFDWLVVIIVGFTSLGLQYVTPNKRPFSLTDPNIS